LGLFPPPVIFVANWPNQIIYLSQKMGEKKKVAAAAVFFTLSASGDCE
jgi:hypothetical protein